MAVSLNDIESIRGKSLDQLPMPSTDATVDFLLPMEKGDDIENEDFDYDFTNADESSSSEQLSGQTDLVVDYDNPKASTSGTGRTSAVRHRNSKQAERSTSRTFLTNKDRASTSSKSSNSSKGTSKVLHRRRNKPAIVRVSD